MFDRLHSIVISGQLRASTLLSNGQEESTVVNSSMGGVSKFSPTASYRPCPTMKYALLGRVAQFLDSRGCPFLRLLK